MDLFFPSGETEVSLRSSDDPYPEADVKDEGQDHQFYPFSAMEVVGNERGSKQ